MRRYIRGRSLLLGNLFVTDYAPVNADERAFRHEMRLLQPVNHAHSPINADRCFGDQYAKTMIVCESKYM